MIDVGSVWPLAPVAAPAVADETNSDRIVAFPGAEKPPPFGQ